MSKASNIDLFSGVSNCQTPIAMDTNSELQFHDSIWDTYDDPSPPFTSFMLASEGLSAPGQITSNSPHLENTTVNPADLTLFPNAEFPKLPRCPSPLPSISLPNLGNSTSSPRTIDSLKSIKKRENHLATCNEDQIQVDVSKPTSQPQRARTRFSLSAVKFLDDWFSAHHQNPYPTPDERDWLARESSLKPKQVNTWFANARRRQLDPMARYMSSSSEDEGAAFDDIVHAAQEIPPLGISGSSESSNVDDVCAFSPVGNYFGDFSSVSSVSSAFDHCPEARRSGPPRKGRKRYDYVNLMYSSYSSAASLCSDTGRTSQSISPLHNRDISPNPSTPQSIMGQLSSKVYSSSQRKHKCKVCDKRFTRLSDLQTHMYSHTGEKRKCLQDLGWMTLQLIPSAHVCEVEGCGRRFTFVSNLRRHRKAHKNDAAGQQSDPDTSRTNRQPGISKPSFQCTFCHKKLSEKAWRRHEESQHVPQHQWTCMPWEHPFYDYMLVSKSKSCCIFCATLCGEIGGDRQTKQQHIMQCPKRVASCLERPVEERTFGRKDHLIQHLRQFHDSHFNEYLMAEWESENKELDRLWGCGFCGAILLNWNCRATHIAAHFRRGLDMTAWDSSRIPAHAGGGSDLNVLADSGTEMELDDSNLADGAQYLGNASSSPDDEFYDMPRTERQQLVSILTAEIRQEMKQLAGEN